MTRGSAPHTPVATTPPTPSSGVLSLLQWTDQPPLPLIIGSITPLSSLGWCNSASQACCSTKAFWLCWQQDKVDARVIIFQVFCEILDSLLYRLESCRYWCPEGNVACFSVCTLSHLCRTQCCEIISCNSAICFSLIRGFKLDQKHYKKNRLATRCF